MTADQRSHSFHCATLLVAVAAAACLLSSGVSAADIESVPPVSPGDVANALPGHGQGAWRTRTQLVWDVSAQKLTRRSFTFWDPLASESFDFVWVPDVPASARGGAVSGSGRLVWRVRGAASYDPGAQVAVYQGQMRDGHAEGQGGYFHRSGVSYRGGWRRGLMDGSGRLSLPNGDQYVGGFRDGRLHGTGVYIDAAGAVYEGAFTAGVRDGKGLVHASEGKVYRAVWRQGNEIPGSREVVAAGDAAAVLTVQYDELPNVGIGVLVDRKPLDLDEQVAPLVYIGESRGERLDIRPESQRFLDIWRGKAEIQLTADEAAENENYKPSFLGSWFRYQPVSITFEIQNASGTPLSLAGAFLDVAESRPDAEPAVHLVTDDLECTDVINSPRFRLENYGWADVEAGVLKFSFSDAEGKLLPGGLEKKVGRISRSKQVDLTSDLAGMGVDLARLGTDRIECAAATNPQSCQARLRTNPAFGPVAPYVSLQGQYAMVFAKGVLEYSWKDHTGAAHAKSSPFAAPLILATLTWPPECGEGGEPEDLSFDPLVFRTEGEDYRVPLNMHAEVPAGVTGRWRIMLDAPRSSEHDFRIVVQLADGRRIASRPVHLLYFKPDQRRD